MNINVETTLKRHCATLKNGYIDVVLRWLNGISMLVTDIVSMLCNVEIPISNFVSFSTLHQRYLNGDLQCWNKVDPTLKCWSGSVYKKVNFKEHFACNFTNKMKLVGIFQRLSWSIHNTCLCEFLLVADSEDLFKVGLSPSKNFFICFNDSPSKLMKNAFYFNLKALFVLQIFNFLSRLFGHAKLISKFMTSQPV